MAYTGESFNVGVFWFNQNTFDAPDVIDWHQHEKPHATSIKFGTFEIDLHYPDGREETYPMTNTDNPINVPAGVKHRIRCLVAPGRSECMFLHYNPLTGEPSERFMGVRFRKPIE